MAKILKNVAICLTVSLGEAESVNVLAAKEAAPLVRSLQRQRRGGRREAHSARSAGRRSNRGSTARGSTHASRSHQSSIRKSRSGHRTRHAHHSRHSARSARHGERTAAHADVTVEDAKQNSTESEQNSTESEQNSTLKSADPVLNYWNVKGVYHQKNSTTNAWFGAGGCTAPQSPIKNPTFMENDTLHVKLNGETGITIGDIGGDQKSDKNCIWRQFSKVVDRYHTNRLEMDITTDGDANSNPWTSVWLRPLNYDDHDGDIENTYFAGELDLLERLAMRGVDNKANSNYAGCGKQWAIDGCPECAKSWGCKESGGRYTPPCSQCKETEWDENIYEVKKHITAVFDEETTPGSAIFCVLRCEHGSDSCLGNKGSNKGACKNADNHIILNDKLNPSQKVSVSDKYYTFALFIDIWNYEKQMNFKLSVDNISFWKNDKSCPFESLYDATYKGGAYQSVLPPQA